MNLTNKRRILIGIGFILIGLLLNQWFLAMLLSPDQSIDSPVYRFIINLFDVVMIISGSLLIFLETTLKDFLTKSSLVLASILIAIFMIEALLSIGGFHFSSPTTLRLLRETDSYFQLKKNLDIQFTYANRTIKIQTNQHGMRWSPVEKFNPPKERIAFLGDSSTMGMWSSTYNQSFVGVFHQKLQKQNVEALNFGVPGYGLKEMKLLLKDVVLDFKPDKVFIMYNAGNDVIDTHLGVNRFRIVGGITRNNLEVFKRKIPARYRKPISKRHIYMTYLKQYIESTYTYDLIWRGLRLFQSNTKKQDHRNRVKNRTLPDRKATSFLQSNIFMQKNLPGPVQKAMSKSLQTIKEMHQITSKRGIELIIAPVPRGIQIYSTELKNERYHVYYPQRHLKSLSDRKNLQYWDTLTPLRKRFKQNPSNLQAWDSHYNNRGHRWMGEILVELYKEHSSSPGS